MYTMIYNVFIELLNAIELFLALEHIAKLGKYPLSNLSMCLVCWLLDTGRKVIFLQPSVPQSSPDEDFIATEFQARDRWNLHKGPWRTGQSLNMYIMVHHQSSIHMILIGHCFKHHWIQN